MFLPQSLPLCPSGASFSSQKFSVSHQYATQHHIYSTLEVFGQLPMGKRDSAALFYRCLVQPGNEHGAK